MNKCEFDAEAKGYNAYRNVAKMVNLYCGMPRFPESFRCGHHNHDNHFRRKHGRDKDEAKNKGHMYYQAYL